MHIHPTACVSPEAQLGQQVCVGPFTLIESGVSIGDRCHIASHAVIKSGTVLGCDNLVDCGAVLGGRPQHVGAAEKVGRLVIGDGNQIREHVTVHAGLAADDVTQVGHRNLLMVAAHVGHDCIIGNENVIANNVMLAGHVTVQDRAYLSGAVGIHQFCRVGSLAMVGGQARVTQDVAPYVMVDGASTRLVGLNTIGLRRAGMPRNQIQTLKSAYRIAFRSNDPFDIRLDQLRDEFNDESVAHLRQFLVQGKRGFLQDRRGPSTSTIELRVIQLAESERPLRGLRRAA